MAGKVSKYLGGHYGGQPGPLMGNILMPNTLQNYVFPMTELYSHLHHAIKCISKVHCILKVVHAL